MAYGSNSGLTAYAALTGQSLGAADLDVARYNGSAYIDGSTYWDRYLGDENSADAAFPRDGDTVVPTRVVNASYEAAILWANDATALTVTASGAGRIKKNKVDVIEQEFQQADTGEDALIYQQVRYSAIEDLLAPYLMSVRVRTASGFVV